MQKLDFALRYQTVDTISCALPVVIVAAGSSRRMEGTDKLFSPLCGIPVLARTLRAFENCPYISGITVVTRNDKVLDVVDMAEKYAISKFQYVVVGGDTRAQSVKNGVELYKDKAEKLLVHDGARPLVSDAVIRRVVNALNTCDSVTCGVAVKDTVKRVNEAGDVAETLDRSKLIAVQTPQGVNTGLFLDTLDGAEDASVFTDDTSVMEAAGVATHIVDGDYDNIKITTPGDLLLAEAIIEKEW